MHNESDVQAAFNTASMSSAQAAQLVPVGQRARLRSFTLSSQTATYSFLNGSTADGTSLFTVVMGASNQNPFNVNIPGHGVLFNNGIAVSMVSADSSVLAGGVLVTYEG